MKKDNQSEEVSQENQEVLGAISTTINSENMQKEQHNNNDDVIYEAEATIGTGFSDIV